MSGLWQTPFSANHHVQSLDEIYEKHKLSMSLSILLRNEVFGQHGLCVLPGPLYHCHFKKSKLIIAIHSPQPIAIESLCSCQKETFVFLHHLMSKQPLQNMIKYLVCEKEYPDGPYPLYLFLSDFWCDSSCFMQTEPTTPILSKSYCRNGMLSIQRDEVSEPCDSCCHSVLYQHVP